MIASIGRRYLPMTAQVEAAVRTPFGEHAGLNMAPLLLGPRCFV